MLLWVGKVEILHYAPPAMLRITLFFALAGLLTACTPVIGDDCSTSVDCSAGNERICDRNQPGGYCTLQGCDSETCPDEAICVEWRFMPSRTSETWCMATCSDDSDCRSAYRCVSADDQRLEEDMQSLARVVDEGGRAGHKFCAYVGD